MNQQDVILDSYIESMLLELGMSPTLRGYRYLAEAIRLCVDDYSKLYRLIEQVYTAVAQSQDTTYQSVERNIRHTIKVFADRNRVQSLNRLLGAHLYQPGDYPANGELIGYLSEYVRLHYQPNLVPTR